MHYLQRNIIKALAFEGSLSFTELKPDDVSNSQFGYHLKQLTKGGYIEKADDAYRLSPQGKLYVDKLSFENFAPRKQPKAVNILYIKNTDGQLLLYERKHEPYKDMVSLPSGKPHMGERFTESAERELKEKAGISTSLEFCGVANIQINDDGEIISHIYGFIFKGKSNEKDLDSSHPKGRVFWGEITEQKNIMPGTLELIAKIKNSENLFVFDETFQL